MESEIPTSPPEGDWRQQMRTMAVTAVDPAREQRAAQGSRDMVRRHVASMVIFTFAIAAGMGLYFAGVDSAISVSEDGPTIPIVLIPVVAIAFIGGSAGLIASRMREAAKISDDWMAPLGLEITDMPRHVYSTFTERYDLEGSTIMSGHRHGRAVEISLGANRYETVVEGAFPQFKVTSSGSGLEAPQGTPSPVTDVISPLRGKRWARLEVTGGHKGIRVRRKIRSREAMESLWLSDLWLAERLGAELDRV